MQTCDNNGNWGPCMDTPNNQGPSGCVGQWYDENCCEQSGACCAHAVNGQNFGSVGNCTNVDPCHSCTQLCAPNAVRWCSVPLSMNGPLDIGDWGTQTCGADGTWGTCSLSNSAPNGCGSGQYDGACCQQSGQCCEVFDSENADPQSVNCPTTSCDNQWADAGGGNGGADDAGNGKQ